MIRLVFLLNILIPLASFANVIAQFDLSAPGCVETGESGQVAGWNSASGLVLVPAVTNSPAWSAPELAVTNGFDGVFFNLSTNPASPLAFTGTATNTVSTLFLVVSGSSGGYSTLLHATFSSAALRRAPRGARTGRARSTRPSCWTGRPEMEPAAPSATISPSGTAWPGFPPQVFLMWPRRSRWA